MVISFYIKMVTWFILISVSSYQMRLEKDSLLNS